jgi:hypothetical protein
MSKYYEELKKMKHSNPAKGAKNVRSMIEKFESFIASDIEKYTDPASMEVDEEEEDEEDEE